MPQQANKEDWCTVCTHGILLVFQGEKGQNTYTPKSLPVDCGGPRRMGLVYRFWCPTTILFFLPFRKSPYLLGCFFLSSFPRRVPLCAVKTCAVRAVFARVAGELRAADPRKCLRAYEANASLGEQSEAARRIQGF